MSPVASLSDSSEWLEADGLGGFASGTATGIRTRRYHPLLLTATAPPAGRTVLVNGMDVWLDSMRGSFALSSQRYAPEVVHPDGVNRLGEAGLGHVSAIADAEPPHTPRGCPFRAWSLGELLRLDRLVLAEV